MHNVLDLILKWRADYILHKCLFYRWKLENCLCLWEKVFANRFLIETPLLIYLFLSVWKKIKNSISYLSEIMTKCVSQQNLLKKQVETRTADGRRRITPLCIAQLDTGYVWKWSIKSFFTFLYFCLFVCLFVSLFQAWHSILGHHKALIGNKCVFL